MTYSYSVNGDGSDENMDAALIDAAKKLSEGQVSEVIETDAGYYVIRLDKKYDKEATDSKKESLHNEKVTKYYDDILEGWKDEITWTVDEKAWEQVSFEERFINGASEDADAAVE